jgi:hypothetical protein
MTNRFPNASAINTVFGVFSTMVSISLGELRRVKRNMELTCPDSPADQPMHRGGL